MSEAVFICCLLLAINIGDRFLNDGDTFWHIVTGYTVVTEESESDASE
ncbi:MAG: hypothetical protein AB1757_04320 [Acidobacteriota bacterium]